MFECLRSQLLQKSRCNAPQQPDPAGGRRRTSKGPENRSRRVSVCLHPAGLVFKHDVQVLHLLQDFVDCA